MKKIILTCLSIGTSLAAAATLAEANTVAKKVVYNTRTVTAGSYKATVKGVVANDAGNMTEFIPLYYLQQALKANGYGATWNGKTLAITTPASLQVNLGNVKPGTGNTAITINGKLLQNAPHIVAGDPYAHNNPTSYMPAYYLDKVLARAGFNDDYNGSQGSWSLTPPPVKADVTTLISAIQAAQTVAQNAVVANNPGDYAQSDLDVLNAAIGAAQTVATSGTTSQATVDAAVQTLNTAVTTFENTAVPGPVVRNVHIASSNTNSSVANIGDTVTLTFNTQAQVSKLGTFKIDGNNPDSFTCTGSGNNWTTVATYTIQDSDPIGLVNFQINVKDSNNVYSVTTEATTDNSSVTVEANDTALNAAIASAQSVASSAVVANNPGDYAQSDLDTLNTAITAAQQVASDTTANQTTVDTAVTTLNNAVTTFEGTVIPGPVISDVTISSNNADPTVAHVGDTVTLTFKTQEQVYQLSTFKIDGNNPDTFTCTGSGNSWTTVATYTIQNSDPTGLVNFQINVKDDAGVYGVTTEATTDNSSVTVS